MPRITFQQTRDDEAVGDLYHHNYRHTGKGAYIGTRPSKASVQGICRKISGLTEKRSEERPIEAVVVDLNRVITGWANYFSLGQTTPAYRTVNYHAETQLRRWLCHKHKVKSGRK